MTQKAKKKKKMAKQRGASRVSSYNSRKVQKHLKVADS